MVRTAFAEARHQNDKEIEMICQVIYNRWQSGLWGSSIKEVVLADRQFSPWNRNSGQRHILFDSTLTYEPLYVRVKSICLEVVEKRQQGIDTSKGVSHFYHPKSMLPRCVKYKKKRKKHYCTRWRRLPPSWAYTYEYKVKIGDGIFFRKM